MLTSVEIVHKNTSPEIYERAARGDTALFYNPGGAGPLGVITEGDFACMNPYWVDPHLAWGLRGLILEGRDPWGIVDTLGLCRLPLSFALSRVGRHREDSGPRRPSFGGAETYGYPHHLRVPRLSMGPRRVRHGGIGGLVYDD